MDIQEYVAKELQRIEASGNFRFRRTNQIAQGTEVQLDNVRLINFCSNDYLGLSGHKDIVQALQSGAERFGVGSGASHLVCGYSAAHAELEERLAAFVNRQRVLLFSTGYMANAALANVFLNRKDELFADKLVHASMIDAASMSNARLTRYRHCDVDSLANALTSSSAINKLVVTDSVFSMDGDIAPLPEIAALCKSNDAWLGVDDAHGFGVLGKHGAGVTEHYAMSEKQIPLLMATLGKAVGCFGAFIAGNKDVIELLLQTGRSYIYTTAPPPALAVAAIKALEIMQSETWRREHLNLLINRFKCGAKDLGLSLQSSDTPIQPLLVGSSEQALTLSRYLFEQGILVTAIRPPTVPKNTARLRITLTASHSETHVDRLLDALAKSRTRINGAA